MNLPAVLRNVLRSEFSREPHSLYTSRRRLSPLSTSLTSRIYIDEKQPSTLPGRCIFKTQVPLLQRRSSSTATDAPVAQLHKETESWEDDSQTPEAKIGSVKSSKGVDSAEGQKPALDSSHAKKRLDTGRIYTQSKPKRKREKWQVQKEALKEKFTEGWNPPKKLSPDALEGIRHLHAIAPDRFTTPVLAEQFQVSPEAIRRILKSKWRPSEEELENRRKRWEKRHDRIWSHLTELGLRPKTRRTKPLADNKMLYNKRDKGRKS